MIRVTCIFLLLLVQSVSFADDWNLVGFDGEPIYSIAVNPVDKNTLFISVKDKGILKSTDSGLNWSVVFNIQNPVNCIAIDRFNLNNIYAGYNNGVLVSSNGGDDFNQTFIGNNININAIILDETQTQAIIIGTDKGIYKSFDKGKSFQSAGLSSFSISSIAIDNSGAKALLYVATSTAGIFKSANYGTSWTPVNKGLSNLQMYSILCDRKTPTVLYAGTLDEKIYKSENGGNSWEAILINNILNQGYVFAQAIDNTSNTSIIYMTSFSGDVYSISDNVNSVTQLSEAVNNIGGTCIGVTNIIPSVLYLGTLSGLYKFE